MTVDLVLIYARKSAEAARVSDAGRKLDDSISVANQLDALGALAARLAPGAPVEEFADDKVSGGKAMASRRNGKALLDRLGEVARLGLTAELILGSQSRATRAGVPDIDVILDAAEAAGIAEVRVLDGADIVTDKLDRFNPHLQALLDKKVRDEAVRKALRTHKASAEAGRPFAGRVPFGFRQGVGPDGRRTWEVDEVERKAIEYVWAQAEAGLSAIKITALLNAEGEHLWRVTEVGGDGHVDVYKPWIVDAVNMLLRRPIYTGLRPHNGTNHEGRWEHIIGRDRWLRMQEVRPFTPQGRRPATHWLVGKRGALRCGECGGEMHSTDKGTRAVCSMRDGRHTSADLGLVTAIVAGRIAELLADAKVRDALGERTDDTTPLRDRKAALLAQQGALGIEFAKPAAERRSDVMLAAADKAITAELADIEAKLNRSARLPGDIDLAALADVNAFLAQPEPVKRQVASLVLDKVTVGLVSRGYLSPARKLGPVGSDAYDVEVLRLTRERLAMR